MKKGFQKKSNKPNIVQALSKVSLAGVPQKNELEIVLKVLAETDCPNYIILFKGIMGRNDYRGLYSHNADSTVTKIAGPASAPEQIEDHMVASYFKYNLGQKEY